MSDADAALRARFPEISWEEPQPVTIPGSGTYYVCRLCVATKGLRASEIETLPFAHRQPEVVREHIRLDHL